MHSSLQILSRFSALALVTMLAACGGGGANSNAGGSPSTPAANAPNTRPVADSDLEIAQKLYSDNARTPSGFYDDPVPNGIGNVSTFHLKNTDVATGDTSSMPIHELCTDDWNQALTWSETVAGAAATYSNLVGTGGDTRVFEFDRQRPGSPGIYERVRVYKCAYLDRSPVDLRDLNGAAGNLNQTPLSAAEIQQLSEYLWRFTSYNNFGHAVLKSSGASGATQIDHTLIIANLVRSGTSSTCDRVDVVAWKHSADAATGSVTRSVTALWSFGARETSGVAALCE